MATMTPPATVARRELGSPMRAPTAPSNIFICPLCKRRKLYVRDATPDRFKCYGCNAEGVIVDETTQKVAESAPPVPQRIGECDDAPDVEKMPPRGEAPNMVERFPQSSQGTLSQKIDEATAPERVTTPAPDGTHGSQTKSKPPRTPSGREPGAPPDWREAPWDAPATEQEALARIGQTYAAHAHAPALSWAEKHRPDLWQTIAAAERQINGAYDEHGLRDPHQYAAGVEALKDALVACKCEYDSPFGA